MKKKFVIIIIAVVLVAVLIAAIVIPKTTGEKTKDNGSNVNGNEIANGEVSEDQVVDNSDNSSGGGVSYLPSFDQITHSSSGQQTTDTETSNIPTISFPYAIPGTDLVIEQVSSYTGYFIEDGSDHEVSDIAAIVVKNNSSEDLEFAGIGLSQGSRNLAFSASQIPAGATVIIQEQSGAAFTADPYYSATASTNATDSFEMSETQVSVKDNGDGSFTVTNITDQPLSQVKVYFKNYLPDESVYVGGITYIVTLEDVEDGTAVDVYSDHYDSKYSEIVEVVVE